MLHVLCLILLGVSIDKVVAQGRLPAVIWDPNDIRFTRSYCGEQNSSYTIHVPMLNYIYFTCPHKDLMMAYRDLGRDPMRDDEYNIDVYMVNETGFNNCEVGSNDKLVLHCENSTPLYSWGIPLFNDCNRIVCFQFEPRKTFYFISTSNGSLSSLNKRSGGYCKTHNLRLTMKTCESDSCLDCPLMCCKDSMTTTTVSSTTTTACPTMPPTTVQTSHSTYTTVTAATTTTTTTRAPNVSTEMEVAPQPPTVVTTPTVKTNLSDGTIPVNQYTSKVNPPCSSRLEDDQVLTMKLEREAHDLRGVALWRTISFTLMALVVMLTFALVLMGQKLRSSALMISNRRFTINDDTRDGMGAPLFVRSTATPT